MCDYIKAVLWTPLVSVLSIRTLYRLIVENCRAVREACALPMLLLCV